MPRANAEAPTVPYAPAERAIVATTTPEQFARAVDAEYGLAGRLYATLELESDGWKNGQSEVPNPDGPNGREDSWGVCQINLPSHHEITREQALDWRWCITWSAEEFKAGRASQWTVYRLLYNS